MEGDLNIVGSDQRFRSGRVTLGPYHGCRPVSVLYVVSTIGDGAIGTRKFAGFEPHPPRPRAQHGSEPSDVFNLAQDDVPLSSRCVENKQRVSISIVTVAKKVWLPKGVRTFMVCCDLRDSALRIHPE